MSGEHLLFSMKLTAGGNGAVSIRVNSVIGVKRLIDGVETTQPRNLMMLILAIQVSGAMVMI